MTKRARWLVLLGFVLPGSAQLLAGNRRLGRVGLAATLGLLAVGVLVVIGVQVARDFTLSIFTNSLVLLLVQGFLIAYAVLWLILGFDTLRLAKIVRVLPKWRLPVAALSVILTLLPVLGAGWAVSTVGSVRGAISDIFGGGAPAVEPVDGRYNILLLGTDAADDRDSMRPDSISLISVDAKTGQSVMVGLPRELEDMPFAESSPLQAIYPHGFCVEPNSYDPVEGGGNDCFTTGYLNAVYTELEDSGSSSYEGLYPKATSQGSSPGIEATKDAVEGATGLTVQFYVLIDMSGFAKLIDALGGVTVDVKQPIPLNSYEDPDTGEWVDGDQFIEPGRQHLSGDTALLYARVRHGLENGDYDRMQHQRDLQAAILAQMDPANVLSRFQEVAGAGSSLVKTDIPESMLGRFVSLAGKAREFDPVRVSFTPPDVDPEEPDYAEAHTLVANAVAEASPKKEE